MICNIVRVVHRMCKQGHQFSHPLDVKSVNIVEPPTTAANLSSDVKETADVKAPEAPVTPEAPVAAEATEAKAPKVEGKVPTTEPVAKTVSPPPVAKAPEEEKAFKEAPVVDEYQPYIDYRDARPPAAHDYDNNAKDGYRDVDYRRRERADYTDQAARGASNRDRSPPVQRRGYTEENTIKYIKAKNLPPNCDKGKIIEFFSTIPVAYANIALMYDQAGRFCQEAILALNNLNDQIEALSQSGRYIFNYNIIVDEATPSEWEHAQQTQKVFFSRDEKILVRMRGLPYTVKKEEVLNFFLGYDVVPDSVIIGEMGNGKKTGEGVILFKSEEEAQRAVAERNGSSIGRRWIELYLHPYSHFHSFYQAQHHEEFVYLNRYINEENKYRTLRLRGLPFNATKKDLITFFKDFTITDNDVVFEIKDGRATGRALVFMKDPMAAIRAIQILDKEYLGNRYIELEQVSNLPHEF